MRRGMPSTPRKCIGPNVRLKPKKTSQKYHLPSVSSISIPVNFGHQK